MNEAALNRKKVENNISCERLVFVSGLEGGGAREKFRTLKVNTKKN